MTARAAQVFCIRERSARRGAGPVAISLRLVRPGVSGLCTVRSGTPLLLRAVRGFGRVWVTAPGPT